MTEPEPSLTLDGNAIAGVLESLFGADVTATSRCCASCHRIFEIGRHRLYRGAGLVLRCPGCGALAARIVEEPGRVHVCLAGTWTLETRR